MCDRQCWLLQGYSKQHSSTLGDPQAATSSSARPCEGSRYRTYVFDRTGAKTGLEWGEVSDFSLKLRFLGAEVLL